MEWAPIITAYLAKTGTQELSGQQALLQVLGDACQAAAERMIGRDFEEHSWTEFYTGDGRPVLYLEHDPITSLDSVTIGGEPVDLTQPDPTKPPRIIVKRDTCGGIIRTDGTLFPCTPMYSIAVTYKAGLSNAATPLPMALQEAVAYWAAMLFRDRDRIGIATVTMKEQVTSFTRTVPPDVDRMIWAYARPVLP